MSRNVTNPPDLIAQETAAWCFAAAEQMARNYLGLEVPSQYTLAWSIFMALVASRIQPQFDNWALATEGDLLAGIDTDITPGQIAESGNAPNVRSQRVNIIRNTYGAVNHDALGGQISETCTPEDFNTDIQAEKIVIIGNAIHYYVVYGFDDSEDFTLRVRNPWPPRVGSATDTVSYATFNDWADKLVIRF